MLMVLSLIALSLWVGQFWLCHHQIAKTFWIHLVQLCNAEFESHSKKVNMYKKYN